MTSALLREVSSSSLLGDDNFEDSCSICLEPFSSLDPPTVTNCKHEYHFHCILEWSQRRHECPVCWQRLTLKDQDSQDQLNGVERDKELNVKLNSQPVYQDVGPQVEVSDFEQRIMRQFSAVASRARSFSRRRRETMATPATGSSQVSPEVSHVSSSSEFLAFSESLKFKISTVSAKYKESISKSTRGLKQKLAARNDTVKELSREVQREMTSGIAGIARMIEKLDFTPNRPRGSVPRSGFRTVGTSSSPLHEAAKVVTSDKTTGENIRVLSSESEALPFTDTRF